MAVAKILLYYAFTPLADPDAIRLWQHILCQSLGLRGRIIVSPHGLNGTLGGELDACKAYVKATRQYPAFKDIDFKWSGGSGLDPDGASVDFPKLVVRAREELVSFGVPKEVRVDTGGVVGGGVHLSPQEVDQLVSSRDDVVFLDGRNRIEAELGRFEGAIVPGVDNTHDFIGELDSGAWDHLKDKPVITYCTGGIRCEKLSGFLRREGFDEVYQLDGGIVTYGKDPEVRGRDFEGLCYVFDERIGVEVNHTETRRIITRCRVCGTEEARYGNCRWPDCNEQIFVCPSCRESHGLFCGEICREAARAEGIPAAVPSADPA